MVFDGPGIEEKPTKLNAEHHFKGHSIRRGGPLVKFCLGAQNSNVGCY